LAAVFVELGEAGDGAFKVVAQAGLHPRDVRALLDENDAGVLVELAGAGCGDGSAAGSADDDDGA
jgi:hypothetical protein